MVKALLSGHDLPDRLQHHTGHENRCKKENEAGDGRQGHDDGDR